MACCWAGTQAPQAGANAERKTSSFLGHPERLPWGAAHPTSLYILPFLHEAFTGGRGSRKIGGFQGSRLAQESSLGWRMWVTLRILDFRHRLAQPQGSCAWLLSLWWADRSKNSGGGCCACLQTVVWLGGQILSISHVQVYTRTHRGTLNPFAELLLTWCQGSRGRLGRLCKVGN